MSSRKTHPIVSNLQTLLRPDTDIHDHALLNAHFCKKIETAISVLPTVPTLRGVALETISSALVYLSRSLRDAHDSALSSAISSASNLLLSLLSHSPFGWSDILFQWGVVNLARLSAIYGSKSAPSDDIVKMMMSRPFVAHLVKFVEVGVSYKFENGIKNAFGYFLLVSQEEKVNIGWLMAYIISQNPTLFSNGSLLKDHTFDAPPTSSVISSLSCCFDVLARIHPPMVRQTLLGMIHQLMEESSEEKKTLIYLRVIIDMLTQSQLILELSIKDILQIVTPERVLSLMCKLSERSVNEREGEEEGEALDDEEKMEEETADPSKQQEEAREESIMSSLCSLLLQLNGEMTISVIDMLLECAVLSTEEHVTEEEEEDGEINPLRIARGQLLKIIKELLDVVVSMSHKAIFSLVFSATQPSDSISPLQYTVSLQAGLTSWLTKLTNLQYDPTNSLVTSLKTLVENVGMCSSELTSATILNQLLSSCTKDKLSLVLSLYKRFRLRHPDITSSLILQGVTNFLNSEQSPSTEDKFEKWSINFCHLAKNSDISAHFQDPLASSFSYLLRLLPLATPTASLHLLEVLESVSNQFVSENRLTDLLAAVQTLLNYFIHLLVKLSKAVASNGSCHVWGLEQQLSKCRRVLSLFSRGNPLVEIFVCSDIVNRIANKVQFDVFNSTDANLVGLLTGGHSLSQDASLLSYNYQMGGALRCNLLNTRQAQHSEHLYKQKVGKIYNGKDELAVYEMAVTHCSDHVIWLISDVISTSTNQIASSLMDVVAPNSTRPLKAWPELDFTSQPRHTLEFHLSIKRGMYDHPILWKLLLLIATDRKGFLKCSSLIYSLFFILSLNWKKNRTSLATSQSQDLQASMFLIEALGKAGWLARPLCYVGELFEHLTCEEVALLFEMCYNYIKANYDVILQYRAVQDPPADHRILRAILRKNIKKLGHVYCRFVSSKTPS